MNEQIKILIFEDNPNDAELIKRELKKGGLQFTAEVAPDKDSFLGLLDKFVPDILLADYSVPGYNGLAAMDEARKRFSTVPVVIVSGTIGEEFAVECLKAGATDYVLKDKLTKLPSVIERALKEAEQLLEKKRADEALVRLTEELRRSNKELEEFAKVASHDLREPLRAVAGFVQLLKDRFDDKLDDKGRSYIQFAVDGAKRMDELLSGLLECSKAQITDEPPSKIPAQEALNAAITILHKRIIETGAVITFDKLPIVNASGRQLTQLFANLIDNAIKFRSEPGERSERSDKRPAIHVGCQKQDTHWQFSIRDNGIGIEQQFQERIFNIFQRLHTRQQHPGCGVGLTICRKIVERHGGRIWVESQKGQGSTFHFTI